MPKYIIKVKKPGHPPRYMEWSTISDTPASHLLTLDDFKDHYLAEHGHQGYKRLPERLARVENYGCSSHMGNTVEDLLATFRWEWWPEHAGREDGISVDELWEMFSP